MGVRSEANGLQVTPVIVAGKHVTNQESEVFEVYSSSQERVVGLAQGASTTDAEHAAQESGRVFRQWKLSSCASRREILLRMVSLLKEREDELVAAQVEETSCTEQWARFNVTYAVNQLPEIAARITAACTGEIPPMGEEGTVGFLFKEAIGPVLLIAPWNGSVVLATKSLASILAAGCTVVFKASELCPKTHHLIVDLYTQAGVPLGVINVLQASREQGPSVTETLIAHPAIRKVEFIGSAAVGRAIGSLCGKYLKPILMELGGKCPSIVLEDADLEAAATKTCSSVLIHHGQVCFSTDRIILRSEIADTFLEILKKKMLAFPQSQAVNTRIASASYDMLVDAEKQGASFLLGKPTRVSDTVVAPTLVTDISAQMRMHDEEIFGPAAMVVVVNNDEELIQAVNSTSYGLDALMHTRDVKRGLDLARQFESGRVRINGTAHEATFPSSPVKGSGWGSNNAGAGIEEFLLKKVITMDFR